MSEREAWKEVGKLALRVMRKAIQAYLEQAEKELDKSKIVTPTQEKYVCKECGEDFKDRLSLWEHGNMTGHEVE